MCQNYENTLKVATGTSKINSLCLWLKNVTQTAQKYPGIRIVPKFPLSIAEKMQNDLALEVLCACDQIRQLAPQNSFDNVCSQRLSFRTSFFV